jgi:FAD dependent oxidoreductase
MIRLRPVLNGLGFMSVLLAASLPLASALEVMEPAGELPVLKSVDVVVVGGTSGAVAAAVAAAGAGATVFLVAGKNALGDDLAATYQLWLEPGETPSSALATAIYGHAPTGTSLPLAIRPMQAKHACDQALLTAGVGFVFGSQPTEVLRDHAGQIAGVVIANRSGRQAVLGKVVIDATPRAVIARWAGATGTAYPAGARQVQRVVVTREGAGKPGLGGRQVATVATDDGKGAGFAVVAYPLSLPFPDDSFATQAEAEQLARDRTWDRAQVDAAEELVVLQPDALAGQARQTGTWSGAADLPLDACRPANLARMYVLGGCADISRAAAQTLLRPLAAMALGERLGRAAAAEAKAIAPLTGVHLSSKPATGKPVPGIVRASTQVASFRWQEQPPIPTGEQAVPVLATYDVVVVGGGTGGAAAALAAGRQGAKTLVVEYLSQLGGVGTSGLVSVYYHGYRGGFTKEIDAGVRAFDPAAAAVKVGIWGWMPDRKAEWYRQELRSAGVTIWFTSMGVGAAVARDRVTGVVVATPNGRGVVLARVVIDATGAADVAAAAGAACAPITGAELAVQGSGMSARRLPSRGNNDDFTYVDETDVIDVWRSLVIAREKFRTSYDLAQLIDTRERQRIIGDVELSPLDALNHRTWPDTITVTESNFDTHGYYIHPLFVLRAPNKDDIRVPIPYRCLLPRGLDGIIVTGIGGSYHRDALPLVRMQADIQNQGYAMGVAAAMLARTDQPTRALDIKALQRHLVAKGILPPEALNYDDSFPLPAAAFTAAVATAAEDGRGIEVLLTQPEVAKPLLRTALKTATSPTQRLAYATILGMLGCGEGFTDLLTSVAATTWDRGWNFKTLGNFGASLSPLDSRIIALGRIGDRRATPVLLGKLGLLTPASDFSHIRAVCLALEDLHDPAATAPLATFLGCPGMTGHALLSVADFPKDISTQRNDNASRRSQLLELGLARALYRCGDHQGLGERILATYAQDLHGHYARHARAVLAEGKP